MYPQLNSRARDSDNQARWQEIFIQLGASILKLKRCLQLALGMRLLAFQSTLQEWSPIRAQSAILFPFVSTLKACLPLDAHKHLYFLSFHGIAL